MKTRGLKPDETLTFFPSYACPSRTPGRWQLHIHAWICRLEPESRRRRWLLTRLERRLGILDQPARRNRFERRARWFLAKNVKRFRLSLILGSHPRLLKSSHRDGHVHDVLKTTKTDVAYAGVEGRKIEIPIQWIGPSGPIIVSDIDDTLRIAGVGRHRTLLANTFLNAYQPVSAMAAVFRRWQARDPRAAFFYLSAAPWPLYDTIREFLEKNRFPSGVPILKHFRWKDRSVFSLFQHPIRYKTPLAETLFKQFPQRQFILVGDSGERDPEIYGALARRHPAQVLAIRIRHLGQADPKRYAKAFIGVPSVTWHVFKNPKDLRDPYQVGSGLSR